MLALHSILLLPLVSSNPDAELRDRLASAFQRSAPDGFWGAISVVRDGKPVFEAAGGMADLEETPFTADTYVDVGSIAKSFTAAAALRLVDKKKLALDDTLGDVFRDLPPGKDEITIHQLLTHTSGLPRGEAGGDTRRGVVDRVLSHRLTSNPGQRHAYSNLNYLVLAAVVEEVGGKPFESFLRSEVFKKARLKDTDFVQGLGFDAKRDSKRVYDWNGQTHSSSTATYFAWGWGFRGTTGVVSTANDLCRWVHELATGRVLKSKTRELVFSAEKGDYALGWHVRSTEGAPKKVWHGGSTQGYLTHLSYFPEEEIAVAVVGNGETDLREIDRALERALFPDAALPTEASAALSDGPAFRFTCLVEPYRTPGQEDVRIEGLPAWTARWIEDSDSQWIYLNPPDPRGTWLLAIYLDSSAVIELADSLSAAIEASVGDHEAVGITVVARPAGYVTPGSERMGVDPGGFAFRPATETNPLRFVLLDRASGSEPAVVDMSGRAARLLLEGMARMAERARER